MTISAESFPWEDRVCDSRLLNVSMLRYVDETMFSASQGRQIGTQARAKVHTLSV